MRDICRWHVEEFAYFLAKMKSDPRRRRHPARPHLRACSSHEHAEANPHKDNGLAHDRSPAMPAAMKTGMHTKMHNTIGDLYLTVAEEVFKLPLEKGFPTAEKKISGIVVVQHVRSVRPEGGHSCTHLPAFVSLKLTTVS